MMKNKKKWGENVNITIVAIVSLAMNFTSSTLRISVMNIRKKEAVVPNTAGIGVARLKAANVTKSVSFINSITKKFKETGENIPYKNNSNAEIDHVSNESNTGTKAECQSNDEDKKEVFHYRCDQCNHKSTTNSAITPHLQLVHEETIYPCHVCDFKGKTKDSLKSHTQSTHKNIRKYTRDQCHNQMIENHY